MSFLGKILIWFGFLLVILGVFVSFFEKIPYLGKLPGDIYVKKGNFTFYFPLASCVLISVILSLVFYLISKFLK